VASAGVKVSQGTNKRSLSSDQFSKKHNFNLNILRGQCHCRVDVIHFIFTSVARWLSPKLADWCHEKLLDPAKNLFNKISAKIY